MLGTQAAAPKPEDPYRERKLGLTTKLRDVIFALRNDPTTPNPANKAMETAVSVYIKDCCGAQGLCFTHRQETGPFLLCVCNLIRLRSAVYHVKVSSMSLHM
jgi:hypothetical protein